MAKKKKIVINPNELASTTLAIKADSKKSSIIGIVWLFLIFAIFIGGVLYLPDIASYVNSYLNPDVTGTKVNNPSGNVNDDKNKNDTVGEQKFTINDDLKIENEKITISGIKVRENNIDIEIENNTSEIIDLSNENYFLNLYDENNKLLQRIILKEVVPEKSKLSFSYELANNNVKIISLTTITPNEYPAYTVKADEFEAYYISCSKQNELLTYRFNNNKLFAIEDVFEVNADDQNYDIYYSNYSTLSATYNNIGGVTSSVNTENGKLHFRTIINLSIYKENTMSSKIIFSKDTDAKIVKFELEASGYTCK